MTDLDFGENYLEDEGAGILVGFLNHNKALEYLNIMKNDISEKKIIEILTILKKQVTPCKINVFGNKITDSSIQKFCTNLSQIKS